MKTKIGCLAVLASFMGMAAEASAMRENDSSVSGNRGLSPIITIVASKNLLAAESTMTDANPTIIVAAQLAQQAKFDAAYSICTNVVPVGHSDFSVANVIGPGSVAMVYFPARGITLNSSDTPKRTLLDAPKHGELVLNAEEGIYRYYPEAGYLGSDQMTFSVEVMGKIFKVIYSVHVDQNPEYVPPECGSGYNGFMIKELPNPAIDGGKGSALDILELPTDGPLDAEAFAKLHSMVRFSMGSGILGDGGLLSIADRRTIGDRPRFLLNN